MVKKSSPPGLRADAEAIARVAGLKLYSPHQRNQRRTQLDAIRALLARPDFPPKDKRTGLYPRAAVVQWLADNVSVTKDKRKCGVRNAECGVRSGETSNIQHPTSNPESAEIVSLAEREAILARFPPGYQKRYRELYAMWENPNPLEGGKSLTDKMHQELVDIGLVKRAPMMANGSAALGKPAPLAIPDYCSQAEFARLMAELYNVPVYPMMVSNAVNKEGMPGRMSNQSIKTSLAVPWWEEHKVKKEMQGSLFQRATAADLQKKIDDGRRAKIEADEVERSASDRWMQTAVVEGFIEGFGTWLGQQLNGLIEDKGGLRRRVWLAVEKILSPKPEELTVLDTRLTAAFKAANDEFKLECARRADDLLRQLGAERAEQLAERKV